MAGPDSRKTPEVVTGTRPPRIVLTATLVSGSTAALGRVLKVDGAA